MTKRTMIGAIECDSCAQPVEVWANRFGRGYYRCGGCDFYGAFGKARVAAIKAAQPTEPQPTPAPSPKKAMPDPDPEPQPEPEPEPDNDRNPWSLALD